jgi:thiazole synthase
MIQIRLNGEPHSLSEQTSLAELLRQIGVNPQKVAVAKNLEVVLRGELPQVRMQEGDEIEIFQAVGGG